MNETVHIALLLIELYAAIGVMLIGFGYMIGGKNGGRGVAEFYFGRSLRWTRTRLGSFLGGILSLARMALLFWILRPLVYHLGRAVRWLTRTRQRVIAALAVLLLCAMTLVALASPAGAQSVTLKAQGHNMFYADVILNGQLKARALVDTGATYLSMCGRTAALLGLRLGETVHLSTANGVVTDRRTVVRSVQISDIEVHDVAGVVDERPSCNKEMLIGMSVLSKLHMTVDNDRLILVARRPMGDVADLLVHPLWWLVGVWMVLLMSVISISRQRRKRIWITKDNGHGGRTVFRY